MHKCHMVIDLQFGSTGKGLLAGYLAKRSDYDTVICSFSTNAGHTYIDKERGLHVMTQQLPTGITSPTVKNVMIGPGSVIHIETLFGELDRYQELMKNKRLMIHPHAAIVWERHIQDEIDWGMARIGSTTKGVGAAMIERIKRDPQRNNIAAHFAALQDFVVTPEEYRETLEYAESVLVEGAQGFSLSMYHGMYPYTTSRDVSPWQIAADCGLPFKWAPYIQNYGTLRTFPIRVNNRTGSSGPMYRDQWELSWDDFPGVPPELTTVTKLQRRIFTFSQQQLIQALWHCGGYWHTNLFLNFANYLPGVQDVRRLIEEIETPTHLKFNAPTVSLIGYGPDDANVVQRSTWGEDHGH